MSPDGNSYSFGRGSGYTLGGDGHGGGGLPGGNNYGDGPGSPDGDGRSEER